MKTYKEHSNDHDFFTKEHISVFLRNHKTGTDNLGRQYLGLILKECDGFVPKVLDIACGSCVNYETWKLQKIDVVYTGFDLTQKLLVEANKRYGDEIGLEVGYAQEIDQHFKPGIFSHVIIRHFLEHVHNGEYQDIIKKALALASKELIVVFFLTPHDGPEDIIQERSSGIEGHPEITYYWNEYSWKKFTDFVSTLNVGMQIETIHTPGAAHSDFIVRLIK